MRYVSGTKLDERIIRCDLDLGYKEGRQFGRGKSGGQVCLHFDCVLFQGLSFSFFRSETNTGRIMTPVEEDGGHRHRDLKSREGEKSRSGMLMCKTVLELLREGEVIGRKRKGQRMEDSSVGGHLKMKRTTPEWAGTGHEWMMTSTRRECEFDLPFVLYL